MKITLELPWPPSDNRYYRIANNRRYISKEGIEFRLMVKNIFLLMLRSGKVMAPSDLIKQRGAFFTTNVFVSVIGYPPDRRIRDMWNILKALGDSLVKAGILSDDSLIKKSYHEMVSPVKGGKVIVEVDNLLTNG